VKEGNNCKSPEKLGTSQVFMEFPNIIGENWEILGIILIGRLCCFGRDCAWIYFSLGKP
jgi:hypothetical protein